jgi:high-affinity nickel-transport protein
MPSRQGVPTAGARASVAAAKPRGRNAYGGWRERIAGALDPREWRSVLGMAALIALLHVVGWGVLAGLVVPQQYHVSSTQVFGIGLGLTAYTLGMRHAFDADHIAAIDNTTRKLMSDGKRPVSVGFWFSLGHSTIVFGLVALLALGVRALAGQVADDGSWLQRMTGVVGTVVSGAFSCHRDSSTW